MIWTKIKFKPIFLMYYNLYYCYTLNCMSLLHFHILDSERSEGSYGFTMFIYDGN